MSKLCETSINARARFYTGPKSIKYGMSVNGPGRWKNIGDCFFSPQEEKVILDDQLFFFHKNVLGGFLAPLDPLPVKWNEQIQTELFRERGITLNVVGFNVRLTKYDVESGDLNPRVYVFDKK